MIVLPRRVVLEIQANHSANLPVPFSGQYSLQDHVRHDLDLVVNVTLPVEYFVSVPGGETLIVGWEYIAH